MFYKQLKQTKMSDEKINIDNNTKFDINIKWLIQIISFTVVAAWGYFDINSQLGELKYEIMRLADEMKMNSEFRVKWPLGQLGALPDDAEQNLRLNYIEKDIQKHQSLLEDLQYKSIKRDALEDLESHAK